MQRAWNTHELDRSKSWVAILGLVPVPSTAPRTAVVGISVPSVLEGITAVEAYGNGESFYYCAGG